MIILRIVDKEYLQWRENKSLKIYIFSYLAFDMPFGTCRTASTKIILSILTIILTSCSLIPVRTVGHGNLRKAKTVDFCELSNNKDKLIKTTLIYSGVEEYWSARGLDSCRLDGDVYLNLDDYYDSWKDILISWRMRKLFNKYWKYDAIVTTKGIYEESDNGFGHLNTKHGQIKAKYLKFRIIKKGTR